MESVLKCNRRQNWSWLLNSSKNSLQMILTNILDIETLKIIFFSNFPDKAFIWFYGKLIKIKWHRHSLQCIWLRGCIQQKLTQLYINHKPQKFPMLGFKTKKSKSCNFPLPEKLFHKNSGTYHCIINYHRNLTDINFKYLSRKWQEASTYHVENCPGTERRGALGSISKEKLYISSSSNSFEVSRR